MHAAPQSSVALNPIPGLLRPMTLATHHPAVDLVSRKLHEERRWEPFETRLWVDCQAAGNVVVDVGANLGYFSLLSALHQHPPSRVFAFEPAKDNVALLRHNLRLNHCEHTIEAVAAALGRADASGALWRSDDNRGDHQIYSGDGPRAEEPIRILDGARFLAQRVSRIDLLKVDTQGSEYAVLQGLLPLLRTSGSDLRILIELTPFSLRLAGSSGRELISLLADLDLPLAIVDHIEHRLVPSDAESLCVWADNVDATPGDRGFMNIFVGIRPDTSPGK
jgi:FkbM family methyltransferase